MFSAIKTLHKGVDVCINNAGLAHNEPLLSGRTEGWRNMIDVSWIADNNINAKKGRLELPLMWYWLLLLNSEAEGGGCSLWVQVLFLCCSVSKSTHTHCSLPSQRPLHWLWGETLARQRPVNESQHYVSCWDFWFIELLTTGDPPWTQLSVSRVQHFWLLLICCHGSPLERVQQCIFSLYLICTLTLFGHLPLSCLHTHGNLLSLNVTTEAVWRLQAGQEQQVQMV